MPTPLTDPQSADMTDAELADLRARVATASAEGTWAHQCMGSEGCIIHIPADSVRTRRPHIARFGHGEWARDHANAEYVADMHAAMPRLLDEVMRLRAELVRARTAAWQEVAADITAHCLAHNDSAEHGWMTCHCEVADDLRRKTPTPACSCRAEAVHQAGCDTDQPA